MYTHTYTPTTAHATSGIRGVLGQLSSALLVDDSSHLTGPKTFDFSIPYKEDILSGPYAEGLMGISLCRILCLKRMGWLSLAGGGLRQQ